MCDKSVKSDLTSAKKLNGFETILSKIETTLEVAFTTPKERVVTKKVEVMIIKILHHSQKFGFFQ